jgi:DHA2 family multidrug resistance protein
VRSLGGSIGVSLATAELGISIQTGHAELAEHFKSSTFYLQGKAFELSEAAMKMLDSEINRQAMMIGYLNDFYLMMLVSIATVPTLLLIRRARSAPAEPGHAVLE